MEGSSSKISSKWASVLRNYRIGKTLGHGTFAKVKLAEHVATGHKVAIKILNRDRVKMMNMEGKVPREIEMIEILRLLRHPHIIRQYEVVETPTDIYVVMEYVKSGELFDYIVERGRLHEDEARYLFQQIISGVEYCHRNRIVHRDLKPENILLDSKHNIKIIDFGFSNVMHDGHFLKTSCGSPNYAAPEVISGKLYAGPEVDIWSVGVILYALLCGKLPFDDESVPNLFTKIKRGEYTLPDHLSFATRDLIQRMLMVDPLRRISIPQIRQHPWFNTHLPLYMSVPPLDTTKQAREIKEEIIQEVVNIGFDRNHVIESLFMRIHNEATVAYYLVMDNGLCVPSDYFHSMFAETSAVAFNSTIPPAQLVSSFPVTVDPHHMTTGLGSLVNADKNWTLVLQSQAHPRHIMSEIFRALKNLQVSWRMIGIYNTKCRWVHKSVIKFELQLYRASDDDEGKYLLDIQGHNGPQFIFLDLCVSLLRELRVI